MIAAFSQLTKNNKYIAGGFAGGTVNIFFSLQQDICIDMGETQLFPRMEASVQETSFFPGPFHLAFHIHLFGVFFCTNESAQKSWTQAHEYLLVPFV